MDSKHKILLTAYQLFMDKGFYNTSMQDLVTVSGLSKGAFYHYFASKKAIYEAVIDLYFLKFYQEVNWQMYENQSMTIAQIEAKIRQFYLSFVPEILAITPKGFSRYFIMYFEAYDIYSYFKETIIGFYDRLTALINAAEDNQDKSGCLAYQIIAKYEGILFLLAVKPENQIVDLLKSSNYTE